MRYKWKDNFFIIVALMYLQRIPQEMKWEDLTEEYILETKRPCMKIRTVRFGISIIFIFYWKFAKRKPLTSENYETMKNLSVKKMVHFIKKNFIKDIPAAFEFAENRMYGNELLNAFPFDSSNSWVKEIRIENFNFSLLGNNLIHCIINKEGHQVMIHCTYAKKDGPILIC
jgi:hypothetical protein